MSIGILTSGGDAPGMNAAIRAVVRYANQQGRAVCGIYYGYRGLFEGGDNIRLITPPDVAQIINRGGTILRSARYPDFKERPEVKKSALNILKAMNISNLVVIGGDGSFRGAKALFETNNSLKIVDNLFIVCIPASIDNDIPFTKLSIGTDTALNTAVECIDKLRDTAYSHRRVFVIQVMGRNCDYLPYMIGISAGASFVFPPVYPFKKNTRKNGNNKIDISELIENIAVGFRIDKDFFMVIVSEGLSESLKKINVDYGATSTPAEIIATEIANELLKKKVNNVSVRPVVLGYVQRGGTPSHFDRVLATRLGVQAVTEIIKHENKYSKPNNGEEPPPPTNGQKQPEPIMVGLQNFGGGEILKDKIVSVSLEKVLEELEAQIPTCGEECKKLLKYVTR